MEELMTLLGNIESLLGQIKQMLGATEQTPAPASGGEVSASIKKQEGSDMTEEEKKKEEDKKKEMEKSKAKKALENTPSDGVDANDKAEDRIEEEPGVNEENIKDVAKSLALALKSFSEKSKATTNIQKASNDGTGEMFAQITEIMKQLTTKLSDVQKKQDLTEEAILGILKGLKVEDEVKKSLDQQQTAQKGYNNVADNDKMATFIKGLLTKDEKKDNSLEYSPFGRHQEIHKGLRDPNLLKAMITSEGE